MLSINNLSVEFTVNNNSKDVQFLRAVNSVSLDIKQGETLAIVGESGSGKSQLFNAVMGLLPKNASVSGDINFLDQPLLKLNTKQLNKIRGKEIGMIFQDPMTALNPYLRIGKQLTEVLAAHQDPQNRLDKKAIKALAIKILERVQIKDAEQRFDSYPHELSGGMRQRVVIAMALLCKPKLIIADEPTTALDVTIQTEIIRLLKDIHTRENTSIVLITHDLPLVAGLCDRIAVMYAGRIVEMGTVDEIFKHPKHPYTQALLQATPQHSSQDKKQSSRMQAIDGSPPDPLNLPQGCAFNPRCTQVMDNCLEGQPPLKTSEDGHQYRCFLEVSENG
ncbi:MAG: ABC transporter ATP-binding protein [Cocleimonas sp.]